METRTCIPTPPGTTIQEMLEDRKMSQEEFAVRMDMPNETICRLIQGRISIDDRTAKKLEHVLGPSAEFWIGLDLIYAQKTLQAIVENCKETLDELAEYLFGAENRPLYEYDCGFTDGYYDALVSILDLANQDHGYARQGL